MADSTARVVFEADIASIQQAVGQIQKDITQKVAKPVESIGKTTGMMAEKTKSSFMVMSQAVRVLSVAVGDTKSEFINFATNAALQLSIVAEGIKLLAQAWKATLVAAVAAAGFALGYWLQKLILGTSEIEKQKRAVYGLSVAHKEAIRVLSEWNKTIDDSNKSLQSGAVQAYYFGTALDFQKAVQGELEKQIVATHLAIDQLSQAQKDAYSKDNETRLRSLWTELSNLSKRYQDVKARVQDLSESEQQAKDIVDQVTRAHEQEAQIVAQSKEQIRQLTDAQIIQSQQTLQSASAFMQWSSSLQLTIADLYDGVTMLGQNISQGLGNAFAQAIVYGKGFKDAMVEMLKSLGATIISFIVELVAQQLIYYALSALGLLKTATAAIQAEITRGALAAARSVYETVPFPANMFLAPAMGAAAIASMTLLAGTASAAGTGLGVGIGAFAEGGLVSGPMLALVGEGGQQELIAPRSDYEKLLEGGGRGPLRATINVDGRRLAEAMVQYTPDVLRTKGIRGL
jgi:hypothetical protein